MATGKSGYFDVSNGGFTLRINWSETYDITANTSVVSITSADLMSTAYSGYSYFPHHYIKVNGQEVATFNSTLGTHSYYISAKNTFYGINAASGSPPPWTSSAIAHNADGTKSITIEVYINLWRTSSGAGSGTNLSGSQTIALTTIPRSSSFGTISGNTIGSNVTVNISRNSSSFTHQLWYRVGNSGWYDLGAGIGTSKTFNIDINTCSQAPNSTSATMELCLRTFNGSTQIGNDVYKSITVYVPSNIKPSVGISVSDAMGYASTYGGYIKGLSKFKIDLSETTAYGSAIASRTITANGSTYTSSSVTTDVIKSSGTLTISASVTDKRGRSGSASTTATVLNYSAPVISLLKVNRCNSDGTENAQGEYVKVTYSGSVTSLSNKNGVAATISYKKSTSSSWTNQTVSGSYSISNATYVFAADTGSSYNIRFTLSDHFQSSVSETVASTAFAIMHFNAGGKGMAIGKVSEKDDVLDIGLMVDFRDNLYMVNGKTIYGKNTAGEVRSMLGLGTDNTLYLGYGGYAYNEGATTINGNTVYINSKNNPATVNGNLQSTGYIYAGGIMDAGGKAKMWTDGEGGQFCLLSPNNVEWSMDAHDNNFRLYKIIDGVYSCPMYIASNNDMQVFDLWSDASSKEAHIGFLHSGEYGAYLYAKPKGQNVRIGMYDNSGAGSIWHLASSNSYMYHNRLNVFSANIEVPHGNRVYFGQDGYIYCSGGQAMYIAASKETNYSVYLGVWESAWTFCPNKDTYLRLGSPSCRWGNIYSSNSAISTSDRKLKKNISPLMDKHVKFFTMLQPVSFQFIDGTSGRTHIGFIAQDVEEAMDICGLTDLDFAGFCKDQKTERVEKIIEVEKEVPTEIIDDETGETNIVMETIVEKQTIEENVPIEGEYIYSLRYEEFIALNTHVTQRLYKENIELKKDISDLKDEIAKIKAAIGL